MIYFNQIKWLNIEGTPVGRIYLPNGRWATVVNRIDFFTCLIQHPDATEEHFFNADQVDSYLVSVSNLPEEVDINEY